MGILKKLWQTLSGLGDDVEDLRATVREARDNVRKNLGLDEPAALPAPDAGLAHEFDSSRKCKHCGVPQDFVEGFGVQPCFVRVEASKMPAAEPDGVKQLGRRNGARQAKAGKE